MEFNENYYTKNFGKFDDWLYLVLTDQKVYPHLRIPYDTWLNDYISGIKNRSIDEVKDLLRCLLGPINRKLDVTDYDDYLRLKNSADDEQQKLSKQLYFNEKYKRIEKGYDAWEGITWILELLPYSPFQAITSLEGYLYAQNGLPDDRIIGICQCVEIIYSKFIYLSMEYKSLLNLKPVEFEWLIEELYQGMGYETKWTPATRDGGKDIIASIKRTDGIEYVYVECKLYKTSELTNNYVKAFAYTVNDDKINRGVIFCTGYVNNELHGIDKRISIIRFENICFLLNAHLGSDWEERLDILIDNKRRQYQK